MGVAQKMKLPCPWEVKTWNGHSRPNLRATVLKFWWNYFFSKIYKWFYYHFLKFLLVSEFWKSQRVPCPCVELVLDQMKDLKSGYLNSPKQKAWLSLKGSHALGNETRTFLTKINFLAFGVELLLISNAESIFLF